MNRHAIIASALLAVLVPAIAPATPPPQPEPQGTVSIESAPVHADIYIDRENRAQTPSELSLPPGRHLVILRADGYRSEYRSIDVEDGARLSLSVQMKPITSILVADSDPPGAEVTINGVSYGQAPTVVASLPLGLYRVDYSMPGYKDKTLEVALSDRSPRRVCAQLSPDTATLTVTSSIDDAQIYVNGALAGQGSCTVSRIPAGEVEVRATAKGYRPYVARISLAEGADEKLAVSMEILPSSLKVTSTPPGAAVTIDGTMRGATPLAIDEIEPGGHNVLVALDGFDSEARAVTLEAGAKAAVDFKLKANTGSMLVTTEPEGVTLVVDGRDAGATPAAVGQGPGVSAPYTIDGLTPGMRKVRAIKPGYYEKALEVEIERGKTATQHIKLKRMFIPDYEVTTSQGAFKGMLESITEEGIKMETRPGVTTLYPKADILGHRPLGDQKK